MMVMATVDSDRYGGQGATGKELMGIKHGNSSAQDNLTRAFLTFTQAASSLERSYSQLQGEVARLHQELERANGELDRSLEENARVRTYLAKLLERLPCGVVATNERGEVQLVNPEARRILEVPKDWQAGAGPEIPGGVERVLSLRETASAKNEIEWPMESKSGDRIIGILQENLSGNRVESRENIWILRDLTEQRRTAAERETARRSQALAEVATVLAHEIRNPLGSMELFTGLLADASSHLPETRQWVTHLRAGLRALSSTLSSVVSALTRAISIGTEGANGTVSASDRQAIAGEVAGLLQQLVSLGNTSYQGTYLFSGTAVTTQPFTLDPATQAVTYNGNANSNPVQLVNGTSVQSGIPGSQLFQSAAGSVFGALQSLYNALQSGNNIGAAVTEVQDALSQVSVQRVFYGNALNQINTSENFLSQDKLNLSSQENALVGVDPAVAATNLAQSQTAYEENLAATSRLLNLPHLLDFLT